MDIYNIYNYNINVTKILISIISDKLLFYAELYFNELE